MFKHTLKSASALALTLGLIGAATEPARALTIVDSFDTSDLQTVGMSSGQIQQVENTIQYASNQIASLYSNNLQVNIQFNFSSSVLGQSLVPVWGDTLSSYKSNLAAYSGANPQNTVLASAVQNLGSGNGAGSTGYVVGTQALFNLLGYGVSTPGTNDGTITLSDGTAKAMYWGTTGSPAMNQYSAIAVAQHEIDEVLGGGGQGSVFANTAIQGLLPGALGALDLYRYSAPGVGSLTTDPNAVSYFSVDGGKTNLVDFNQTPGGDLGDFASVCTNPHVQDAFACAGASPTVFRGSIEDTMLQSIGYDSVSAPAPAPATSPFGLAAVLLAGAARKLRKSSQA